MTEITKLKVKRLQLAEKHFYYNGCECENFTAENEQKENEILNLAADVLIQILTQEYKENM